MPRAHEIAGSNPAILTYCGGTRAGTGRRLLTAPTQVRFLPPQLVVPLAERQRCQISNLARRVRFPQGTLGDRLTAGCRALNPAMQVQILLPDLAANRDECRVSLMQTFSGAVAAGSDAWL